MFEVLISFLLSFRVYFRTRSDNQLEILALRHQIVVLQRKTPKPKLKPTDVRLWVWLSQCWPRWRSALLVVKPTTVVDWHRRGFRWYWTWKVRHGHVGRPSVAKEARELIRTLSRNNSIWERREFVVNFSSWVSRFRKLPSPNTWSGIGSHRRRPGGRF